MLSGMAAIATAAVTCERQDWGLSVNVALRRSRSDDSVVGFLGRLFGCARSSRLRRGASRCRLVMKTKSVSSKHRYQMLFRLENTYGSFYVLARRFGRRVPVTTTTIVIASRRRTMFISFITARRGPTAITITSTAGALFVTPRRPLRSRFSIAFRVAVRPSVSLAVTITFIAS